MNGKQLKNSILQWAIQGKLVPQDPNDEPASVLLERIRAEKARLVKEKKIKKDKNESIIYRGDDNSYYEKFLATGEVKCIDEEIPFEIPNGWQWERIGNIFETTSGSTPLSRNPDYYKNGNINWVRTTDLNNGILNKTEIQITSKAIIDYNLSILPQTSVCVAMYGGAGTIGKHCILHFDTTINQSVCAIQPNGFCNMDYIHTFIEYQRPFWWLLVVAVTNSPKHDFNRCKSATCRFLFRDTKSARDKNGTKPRKNKVKDTSPEISLVEYLCFVCKGTNLSLEKRGEIPISLIHNSFSYYCTPNVVIANGFDLKQHDLRKSGVKFCFAL